MTSAMPSRSAVPSPTPKSRPGAAVKSRRRSLALSVLADRAGSAHARQYRALPAGAGRNRRPVAGWLCQSPRAREAVHVSRRHVRARPRGLRQLPLQKLGVGVLRNAGFWGPRHHLEEGPRGAEGCLERPGRRRSSVRSSPQPARRWPSPLPGFRRARWRFPGARRPGVVHRLDPGGPAVGRLPQFHGWFGAR